MKYFQSSELISESIIDLRFILAHIFSTNYQTPNVESQELVKEPGFSSLGWGDMKNNF